MLTENNLGKSCRFTLRATGERLRGVIRNNLRTNDIVIIYREGTCKAWPDEVEDVQIVEDYAVA